MTLSFHRLSIRAKLAAILGVTIFALAATRALGLSQLGAFLDRFESYTATLETTQQALLAAGAAERGFAAQLAAVFTSRSDAQAASRRLGSAFDEADQALATLERLASEVGLERDRVQSLREAHRGTSATLRAALGDGTAAFYALEHPQAALLRELTARLTARFEAAHAEAVDAHETETRIMNGTYISMLALVIAAGLVAYFLIAKMVTRPLRRMVEVANTVAAGDLRSKIEVTSEDELGQVMRALADMNRSLAGLIGKVHAASSTIGTGSGEIDAANAGLAERMADQAAALEQTASTMEQLTTTVARNAEHARRASERAGNASRIADKGGAEVRRVVETMNSIDSGARRITDIIGVIDSIAFQTNILALNAAVEAARAGEQGRGFAVVATEVRSLAQKSAAAAREIKALIEESLAQVEAGSKVVQSAGNTMADIVSAAQEVTETVADIATVSAEQAHGLQEVNRAVADMDQKTRRNSELVEHAAEAARAMRAQAALLHEAIAVFRLADETPVPDAAQRIAAIESSAPRRLAQLDPQSAGS